MLCFTSDEKNIKPGTYQREFLGARHWCGSVCVCICRAWGRGELQTTCLPETTDPKFKKALGTPRPCTLACRILIYLAGELPHVNTVCRCSRERKWPKRFTLIPPPLIRCIIPPSCDSGAGSVCQSYDRPFIWASDKCIALSWWNRLSRHGCCKAVGFFFYSISDNKLI